MLEYRIPPTPAVPEPLGILDHEVEVIADTRYGDVVWGVGLFLGLQPDSPGPGVRPRDEFFGKETRYGHRIYGGLAIKVM
jgi:hypothetical protein